MNQPVCPGAELLRSYLLGATSEDQAVSLEKHLESCTRCQGSLQTVQAEDGLVLGLRAQRNKPRFSNPLLEKLRLDLRQLRPPVRADPPSATMASAISLSVTPAPAASNSEALPTSLENPYPFLSAPQTADELGRLGGYRVLKVLGAGGMGLVFDAEEVSLRRRVALKVMRPTLAADAHARQRFLREAQATAALVHDHIVAIHFVGEQNGVPFLAMPLLMGEMLEERVKRLGKLPLAEVLRIGKETALGLAAAHTRNIIHRDIKPGNLWLEAPSGRVKILDFGLAWMERPENEQTNPGTILGTPGYMAPEQVDGEVDARADLFSLGCVLYRLSTGELPFKGQSALQRLRSLLNDTPVPPQQLAPDMPTPVATFLMRLLARKREDRPVSAAVVAKVLDALQGQVPATPAPVAVPRPAVAVPAALPVATAVSATPGALPVAVPAAPPGDQPTVLLPRPVNRHRRLAVLAAGAALLLMGLSVAVFSWLGGRKPVEGGNPEQQAAKVPRRQKRPPVLPRDLPPSSPLLLAEASVSRPTPIKGLKSWNIESGRAAPFEINEGVQFLDDGTLLLRTNYSQNRLCWDLSTSRLVPAPCDGAYSALTPDRQTCVRVAGNDAQLWDAGKPRQRVTLTHTAAVNGAAFSPDGRVLATGADGLYFWDVKKGDRLGICPSNGGSVGSRLCWSPDGTTLATHLTPTLPQLLHFVDFASFKAKASLTLEHNIYQLTWSPDGTLLAAICQGNRLVLISPSEGRAVYVSEPNEAAQTVSPAWSSDSKQLVFAGLAKEVVLWDVKDQRAIWKFRGHAKDATTVAISPDGETVVSASQDASARFWDPQTGQHRGTLLLFSATDWVAITPEGHYKGSREVEGHFLYKARSEKEDALRDYTAAEFAAEFGWENKPDLVKFSPPLSEG